MRSALVAILVTAVANICAQEYPKREIDIAQLADDLYSVPDTETDVEDLYENLLQLLTHPVNLNKATAEDLRFIQLLSESQINQLLKYRSDVGNFVSVYELQAVPEFDLTTLHKLAPFVTVNDHLSSLDATFLTRVKKEGDHYLLVRYERTVQLKNGFEKEGGEPAQFRGSPDKLYMRFRSSRPGDFSFGFSAEKDPGEELTWSPGRGYYGADYLSCHLQIQNKGRLKNLIIGDYQTQFGQGLMLGGVLGMGKGGETITTIRRSNIGLLPYTSAYEAGTLRGIAVTVRAADHLHATGFYSNVKKDGTLDLYDDDEQEKISAFQTTGLHRTEKELDKRKRIKEKNAGFILQYDRAALSGGIMFNQTSFDADVQPNATAYNQFAFRGKVNRNAGLFLNYNIQNISAFAEVAHSFQGSIGATAGLLAALSPKLDLSLLYRNYGMRFYTFYSSGLGENTNTQNERGLYWGWRYTFSRRYQLAGYIDIFRFPWLRFRSYAPSDGYEWLLRFQYDPSRKVKMFIQAREETKSRNTETDRSTQYQVSAGKKNSYCLNVDYAPHDMLRLKSRVQLSTYTINGMTSAGMALIQDIVVDAGKLKLTMRYAIFETDDHDNRQYSYENDVWLAYSMPAYGGAGVRKMAIVEYKINRNLSVWLRYSHIRYENLQFIGDGLDRIDGDQKDDVKAQVVVKF
ncbi:MAG TPA: helix-hairpin-helix domain-containing protein [Chryseolinea sp.]